MNFLIDHNLKGHALVFFGAIAAQGWLDYVQLSRDTAHLYSVTRKNLYPQAFLSQQPLKLEL
jgi:hypothetical protein